MELDTRMDNFQKKKSIKRYSTFVPHNRANNMSDDINCLLVRVIENQF